MSTPTTPTVRIVTVNWNAGDLLRACAASVPSALTGAFALEAMVVVDNASADGSADGLEADALVTGGGPLTVLRNPVNRGFAAACNQGAAGSRADWLLFLNPDTRLSERSLPPALAFLAEPAQARTGVLGIRLVDEAGRTQRSCARVPTPGRILAQAVGLDRLWPGRFPPHFMAEWDHLDSRPVEQVMGAFLLIRRSLFEELDGFDERFFVYFDDVDLCLRARQAGWEVMHFAGAEAFHRGCGTTDRVRDLRLFYALRSRIQFAAKHFTAPAAAVVATATLTVEPLVRLAHALASRSPADARAVLRGSLLLWRSLPGLLAPPHQRYKDMTSHSP
ncbi:glycosyltransferase [Azospirillum formosense]|uniref:Glycosyltransferase n=1 Tax=Azospirillum formosense TaxID=861533 RepID=A0ABX2L0H5_9PROT|nr:glycosyltransferase family 2 protein [Azospirillum formosense]MBY3757648.1 glycosyltransferase family 2 protein [Azospirillum formosense]NUB21052.1 glycosyltransferase [Azospirillum formosense]